MPHYNYEPFFELFSIMSRPSFRGLYSWHCLDVFSCQLWFSSFPHLTFSPHLTSHSLLSSFQLSLRTHHSNETAKSSGFCFINWHSTQLAIPSLKLFLLLASWLASLLPFLLTHWLNLLSLVFWLLFSSTQSLNVGVPIGPVPWPYSLKWYLSFSWLQEVLRLFKSISFHLSPLLWNFDSNTQIPTWQLSSNG